MGNEKDVYASLQEAISILEIRQAEEGRLLKEHLIVVYDKLKPINLIKGTFDDIATAIENRKGLVNSLIGVLTGYVIQRIVIGSRAGLFKKLTGVLLNYGVAAVVSKYAETVKMMGLQLFNQLFPQKGIENTESVADNSE